MVNENNLNLNEFWRILKSQGWMVGIVVALGIAISFVYAFVKPPVYKTEFVIEVGIVGDTWLHSPILAEERCTSLWFLNQLSRRTGGKYDTAQLGAMIQPELVLTPTKGLTRAVKVSVTAGSAEECFRLATAAGELLVANDQEMYDRSIGIYDSYLEDLEGARAAMAAAPAGKNAEAGLNVVTTPPDEKDDAAEYYGGGRLMSLFDKSITEYRDNPYLVSNIALLEQVYINTAVKVRSPVFSQPTIVVIPAQKPTRPETRGILPIVLMGILASVVLGMTLAAVTYRVQQGRGKA